MSEQKLCSTISSILLYSGLEFLSLLCMHAIQGVFMTWALIVLSFTLTHYGNDLTFRFERMHQ